MSTTYDPAKEVLVDGSGINKLCPDFKDVNTLGELEALDIYSHLEEPEKGDAYDDLLEQVANFNGEDELDEMSVNHTNGVTDNYAGTGTAISTSTGALVSSGVLVLTPDIASWKTHDIPAIATKLIVKTNIIAADLGSNGILVSLNQARRTGTSTATSGQRIQLSFGANSGDGAGTHGVISGGPSYTGNVGDDGTFYAEIDLAAQTGTENEIGSGNTFDTNGKYYYIIGITVDTASDTKLYKFKVFVQYD